MFAHELVLTEMSEALLLIGRVDEARASAERLLALSHAHTGRGYQAMPAGSSATLRSIAIPSTPTRPLLTTTRPFPSPMSWACVRS